MDVQQTQQTLTENVVPIATTIWKAAGTLDLEANAANAEHLFAHGMTAAIYAGGLGEHDRFSIAQQEALLKVIMGVAHASGKGICIGSGLGRTVERVRALAPTLGKLGVSFAMLMPPPIDDPEGQYAYYSEVIHILKENGVWPMPYLRPEHPVSADTLRRLFDAFEIPAVKLANDAFLLYYAEVVHELGHKRSAWLCGTAGWWLPAYFAVGAARGMSSGLANAIPEHEADFLRRVLEGRFRQDKDYWGMVAIERLRRAGDGRNNFLTIKYLQELVGLKGGMNGDGAQLPDVIKPEVERTAREAGWLSRTS